MPIVYILFYDVIALNESISDNIIKYCMLFIMKEGVTPMWEDSQNRYKVINSMVSSVFYSGINEQKDKN
jgi:hypothetical protein